MAYAQSSLFISCTESLCLHLYEGKWYVLFLHSYLYCFIAIAELYAAAKIIEEQLAFPSGTATAQLISVLHKIPPPNTSFRQRKGYNTLRTEEDEETQDVPSSSDSPLNDEVEEDVRQTVEGEGWFALAWSFVASGLLTVSERHYSSAVVIESYV
jgi:uncharacterized oligopeptide transporter (OPT) family protein